MVKTHVPHHVHSPTHDQPIVWPSNGRYFEPLFTHFMMTYRSKRTALLAPVKRTPTRSNDGAAASLGGVLGSRAPDAHTDCMTLDDQKPFPMAAETGHHHEPLVARATSIRLARPMSFIDEYGTAATTIRAFYDALLAGVTTRSGNSEIVQWPPLKGVRKTGDFGQPSRPVGA